MVADRIPLRLALSKSLGCALEICDDGFEQRIPVFYDNSGIEALTLNNGVSCTNSETIGGSMLLEPGKEQPIAIGLTPVTIVTHVEQHIKMLFKKYIKDGKNCLFYFCIMWRTLMIKFLNDKLESVTTSHRRFIFERDKIVDTKIGGKNEITIWGVGHLIWRLGINLLKREFYHSDTIVPVNPIAFHSSAMRFSAFRLISSERLKRARASSYVTFFISIILTYLTFHAANLRIKSEITSKMKKKSKKRL